METLEDRRVLSGLTFSTGYLPASNNAVSTEAVAMDAFGNTYVTGGFTGTVSIGGNTVTSRGNADGYVAKLNPGGTVAWVRRFGAASTADGDFGRSVAVDPAGNVYVTGFIVGSSDFAQFTAVTGPGARDLFTTKLDANGAFLWVRTFGGTSDDIGQSIAADSLGNSYVTGSYTGTANFGGTTLVGGGGADAFVMKLNPSGGVAWAKRTGGAAVDSGFSVALDGAGNVYTTGIFGLGASFGATVLISAGDSDAFVQKMDNNGNVVYAKRFGGVGHDDGISLAADAAGNVVLTGDFTRSIAFGGTTLTQTGTIPGSDNVPANAAFVTRLNGAGDPVWARSFGADSRSSAGFGVALDPDGNAYLTGVYQGTVAFGGTNLTSNGDYDVYEAKLDSGGNVLDAQGFGSTVGDQAFGVAYGGRDAAYTLVGNYGGPLSVAGAALPTPVASTAGAYVVQFNQATTRPPFEPPSDFDGVGRTELAVFRNSTAQWFVRHPTTGGRLLANFGATYYIDIPVAGDYLGLGRSQTAVFRPATAQWFVNGPSGGQLFGTFGGRNLSDIPVPGDYDGVGKTQLAVFRPATAQWFVNGATGGRLLGAFGARGLADLPVPGDYDGIGRAELAVYRPSTGQWFISRPGLGGQLLATFGTPNFFDIPAPGDYDGTGRMQIAVYRPSTAELFVYRPTGAALFAKFGAPFLIDIPTQSPVGALRALKRTGGVFVSSVPFAASAAIAPPAGGSTRSAASAAAAAVSAPAPRTPAAKPRAAVVTNQGAPPSSPKVEAWPTGVGEAFRKAKRS